MRRAVVVVSMVCAIVMGSSSASAVGGPGDEPEAEPSPGEAAPSPPEAAPDASEPAAEPPEPAPGTSEPAAELPEPDPVPPEVNEVKEQARAHFLRGLELLQQRAYDAALVEFNRSRALYPTRGNALNAAVALRELGRYDEALVIFNELLADEAMPAEERQRIENEIRVLDGLLGSVSFRGVVPEARVVVDGREVGITPLVGPLRLSAGTRLVRIVAADFHPWERRVEVPARGEITLDVEMVASSEPLVVKRTKDKLPPYEGIVLGLNTNFVVLAGLAAGGAPCPDECRVTPTLGGLALAQLGWEFGTGFGLAGEVGGLLDWQQRKNDVRTLIAEDYSDAAAIAQTTLSTSALIGLTGWYRFFDGKVPFTAGLSIGAGLGRLGAQRTGRFANSAGAGFDVDLFEDHFLPTIYASPFFRAALPVGEHMEIAADIRLFLQVLLSKARWDNEQPVAVPDQGTAVFADESGLRPRLAGLFAPGAHFRWEL